MKRKLWILLALAALMAVFWCAKAEAENASTTQPESCTVSPDSYVTVRWTTNFMPVRIEVGCDCGSYQTAFGLTVWISDFNPRITLTSGLTPSKSADIWYDKASDDYPDKWIVRAYDTSSHYIDSAFFTINKVGRSVSCASSVYTIAPDQYATVRWSSNFTPTRVEIGYDAGERRTGI